jgi:hypothetical protein
MYSFILSCAVELIDNTKRYLKMHFNTILSFTCSCSRMKWHIPLRCFGYIFVPISHVPVHVKYSLSLYLIWLKNSVALARERTISTERPPLVGEVSANFCGQRVSRGQRNGSPRPYSRFSRPEPLLFLPNSYSVVLTRLSGPRSRPTTSQKISGSAGNRIQDLWICSQELWSQDHFINSVKSTNYVTSKYTSPLSYREPYMHGYGKGTYALQMGENCEAQDWSVKGTDMSGNWYLYLSLLST